MVLCLWIFYCSLLFSLWQVSLDVSDLIICHLLIFGLWISSGIHKNSSLCVFMGLTIESRRTWFDIWLLFGCEHNPKGRVGCWTHSLFILIISQNYFPTAMVVVGVIGQYGLFDARGVPFCVGSFCKGSNED